MVDWQRRLLGLGLPCLLAFLLDTGLRLCAQPEAYWAGNYHRTLAEGTPFVYALYTWHPLAAVAGYALWAAIIAGLLVLLPECLAVILALATGVGHIGGAYTWLKPGLGTWWYELTNGILLVSGLSLGFGLQWYLRSAKVGTVERGKQGRWFGVVRWCCIVALSGLGYFLYLFSR
jgi:hypothetical protein